MAFRHTTPEGREYISHRPQVTAREAMVVSGHHYASQAGTEDSSKKAEMR